jgi:YD repeat-containing protein
MKFRIVFLLLLFILVSSLNVFADQYNCNCNEDSDCYGLGYDEPFCDTAENTGCIQGDVYFGGCTDLFYQECESGSMCCDDEGNYINNGGQQPNVCDYEYVTSCSGYGCDSGVRTYEYTVYCDGAGNCVNPNPPSDSWVDEYCGFEQICYNAECVATIPENNCNGYDDDCDGVVDEQCISNEGAVKYLYFNDPLARLWKEYPVGEFYPVAYDTDCGEGYMGENIICTQTEYTDVKNQYSDSSGLFSYTTIIDALGNYVVSKSDKFAQLISAKDVLGHEVVYDYGYSSAEDMKYGKVWDARHNEGDPNTENFYNTLGQLKSTTSIDSGVTDYAYNLDGSVDTVTNANGVVLTNTYDGLGRVESMTYNQGSNEEVIEYFYDSYDGIDGNGEPVGASCIEGLATSYGKLCKIVGDTTMEYTYDIRGNVISVVEAIGVAEYETVYDYDDAGNVVSVISYDGVEAVYDYNSLNRLEGVDFYDHSGQEIVSGHVGYEYGEQNDNGEKVGSLKNIIYPSFVTDYEYNHRGLIETIENPLFRESYDYDPVSNLLSIVDIDEYTVDYDYDELYRLVGISDQEGYYLEDEFDIGYEYDPVGNRLVRSVESQGVDIYNIALPDDYDYGDDNKLDSSSGCTYDYDDVGNLISRDCQEMITSYEYYLNGMLKSVTGNNFDLDFVYDPLGRRVRKIDHSNWRHSAVYLYGVGSSPLITITSVGGVGGNIVGGNFGTEDSEDESGGGAPSS